MPKQGCTICNHPKRAEIDALILGGVTSLRIVGSRYGTSATTVIRHRDQHLAQAVAKVAAARAKAEEAAGTAAVAEVQTAAVATVARAKTLLEQLKDLQAHVLRLALKSELASDYRTAIAGVREMARLVELLAKMTGELEWAPPPPTVSTTVNVGVLVGNPDWHLLQRKIVSALQPYPDAREAVLKAIRSIEEPPPPPQSEAAAAQVVELAVIGPGPNRIG